MSASPQINIAELPAVSVAKYELRAATNTGFLVCPCQRSRIPIPKGATLSTRYTCRDCMAEIMREANLRSARTASLWLRQQLAFEDSETPLAQIEPGSRWQRRAHRAREVEVLAVEGFSVRFRVFADRMGRVRLASARRFVNTYRVASY